MRAYLILDERTGVCTRFTNKAKARAAYKAGEREGRYLTASTVREYDGGFDRLDNGTPEWTL